MASGTCGMSLLALVFCSLLINRCACSPRWGEAASLLGRERLLQEGTEVPPPPHNGSEDRRIENSALVKSLLVKADSSLPPFSDGTFTLFEDGASKPAFACPSSALRIEDGGSISYRVLELSLVSQSSSVGSVFDGLFGSAAAPEEEILNLRIAQAKVSVQADSSDGMPLLTAALDKAPETADIQVVAGETLPETLTVFYDCWREGSALVELRLQVEAKLTPEKFLFSEVCLAWTKKCSVGFDALQVYHGEDLLFPLSDGKQETSASFLNPEGTLEVVTKLELRSEGAVRLRPPQVETSDTKVLQKVEVRGPFGWQEEAFEVNRDPLEFSVLYTCQSDGVADVTMTLEQATLTDAHRPESMHLHWRKRCGLTAYRYMDVFLRSETNSTRNEAVIAGLTQPGFTRPCSKGKGIRDGTTSRTPQPSAGSEASEGHLSCSSEAPKLEVNPKDSKTIIEMKFSPAGQVSPPSFQPGPDLSYDRKILKATIVNSGTVSRTTSNKMQSHSTKHSQSIVVRYSCHKAGVSTIMVTLHVLAHKPIDIAWQKRCSEPRVRVGKALTAPQAMMFALLICGFIGLVVCMVCLLCSSDSKEKDKLFRGGMKGHSRLRDRDRDSYRDDIEFSSLRSQKVGASHPEEEVTYHG